MTGAVLFNGDSVSPWQVKENTLVMVTNRSLEPVPRRETVSRVEDLKHVKSHKISLSTAIAQSFRKQKVCDLFCRAIDVRIGDNVWEHNIVSKIELIPEFKDGIKIHYGSEQEANFIDEPDEIKIDLRDCLSDDGRYVAMDWRNKC